MRTENGWESRTNRPSESFGENFSLFHLRTVNLGTDHRAKWNFRAEFLGDSESQCGFAGPGGTDEEKGTTREFTRLDKIHDDATGLGEDPNDWFSPWTG